MPTFPATSRCPEKEWREQCRQEECIALRQPCKRPAPVNTRAARRLVKASHGGHLQWQWQAPSHERRRTRMQGNASGRSVFGPAWSGQGEHARASRTHVRRFQRSRAGACGLDNAGPLACVRGAGQAGQHVLTVGTIGWQVRLKVTGCLRWPGWAGSRFAG